MARNSTPSASRPPRDAPRCGHRSHSASCSAAERSTLRTDASLQRWTALPGRPSASTDSAASRAAVHPSPAARLPYAESRRTRRRRFRGEAEAPSSSAWFSAAAGPRRSRRAASARRTASRARARAPRSRRRRRPPPPPPWRAPGAEDVRTRCARSPRLLARPACRPPVCASTSASVEPRMQPTAGAAHRRARGGRRRARARRATPPRSRGAGLRIWPTSVSVVVSASGGARKSCRIDSDAHA